MKTISPPTLMFFCLIGMGALHLMMPLHLISNWILFAFGVATIVLGLVMAFGAEGQFRGLGTTVDPLGKATKLVTDGWFGYSRNPMYLSLLILLVGRGYLLDPCRLSLESLYMSG